MKYLNHGLRASLLMLVMAIDQVYAHPGHASFGSSEEDPGWFVWVWVAVILIMAAYGGWRLYKTLRAGRSAG